MSKSRIEWTEHTWNPVTGCSKISPGCLNCYAKRNARRLAGRFGYPEAPHHFNVTLHADRLEEPLHRKTPTVYFVPSMGDLFHRDVSDQWRYKIFKIMAAADWHIYQVLTKRAEHMLEFCQSQWYQDLHHSYGLNNVWLGVSIETPEYSYRAEYLRQTLAAVRFISFEPLLASFAAYPGVFDDMDWIIVGGESGPGARPMLPQWVRDIRDQCIAANVPFFFKQWSSNVPDILEIKHLMCAGWDPMAKKHGRILDGREWNQLPNQRKDRK